MGKHFTDRLLDADISRTQAQQEYEALSWEYHNTLLKLLDEKRHSANKDLDLYKQASNQIQKMIATHIYILEKSWDIAKGQLQDAFDRTGLTPKLIEVFEKDNE
tara:strand:- start:967 stop:1278 length:312 start_codon:yes stop_codon:yes gene_type:complete